MEIIVVAMLMQMVVVVSLLAIFFLIRYFVKANPGEKNSKSIISKAIILSVENTGSFIKDQPKMKIQLQVTPDKGRNFVAEVKEILSPSDIAVIRTGNMVNVKYNPVTMKEVHLIK